MKVARNAADSESTASSIRKVNYRTQLIAEAKQQQAVDSLSTISCNTSRGLAIPKSVMFRHFMMRFTRMC
jgi:hypothetical protein